MDEPREILLAAYREFNARHLDALLARMTPDVEWPNGWEGGFVHGQAGVRDYWTRQWAVLDPHVEPINIAEDDQGQYVAEVHQVVRDIAGKVLVDQVVHHAYRLRSGSSNAWTSSSFGPAYTAHSSRPGSSGFPHRRLPFRLLSYLTSLHCSGVQQRSILFPRDSGG